MTRLFSVLKTLDAVANDVQEHLICWVHIQRKVASGNDDTIYR